MQSLDGGTQRNIVIRIGEIAIALLTDNDEFAKVVEHRYADFIVADSKAPGTSPEFTFAVTLVPPESFAVDADAAVWMQNGEWRLERGDFKARWNPATGRGEICQSISPYSIDSVLRILHTLLLAQRGGFLLHASSAVRNGRAYLFSGVSEAGKTTIARLAPADVQLLTDEASYVSKQPGGYLAHGTPFAGELGEPGKNISAPIAALYLLEKADHNEMAPLPPAEAVRRLMRNILFFAHDPEMVKRVFEAACEFVASVPVFQLSFYPDPRVWEIIG